MATYLTYQKSKSEFFDKIPDHWNEFRIKSVIKESNNGIWGNEPEGNEDDLICVRVADFCYESLCLANAKLTLRNVPIEQQKNKLLNPGDLLIEKSGGGENQPVGRAVKFNLNRKAICSNFIGKIVPQKDKVLSDFLIYCLSDLYAKKANIKSIKQTTGIQNLDLYSYFNEKIPIPTIGEQEIIANYLDHKTRLIDTLIEKKQKQIELLREQRAAIINQAVTKGLNPNVKMKDSGIEWLGEVPRHWDIKWLKNLFGFEKGKNAQKYTKEYIAENPGNFPVYSGQTENHCEMGKIGQFEYETGPTVFVTTVGAKAMTTRIVQGQYSLSQNCALIRPKIRDLSIEYYELMLQQLFRYERGRISLIMQPSLRFEDLVYYKIPYPSEAEQKSIVYYLGQKLSKIDSRF